MELLMKTYKQFNEQAQHHLHEIDRMNFGIPGGGLIAKGLGYLAKPMVYRTLGTIETGHQLYKDIKNKKPIGKTVANTAGNLLTTFAPYEKGFLKALRSKRFLGGVGLNMAGYDEKSDNTNNKNNTTNKVQGSPVKGASKVKPQKFNYDTDFINNKKK